MRIICLIFILLFNVNLYSQEIISPPEVDIITDCVDYKDYPAPCAVVNFDTLVTSALVLGNFINDPTTLNDIVFDVNIFVAKRYVVETDTFVGIDTLLAFQEYLVDYANTFGPTPLYDSLDTHYKLNLSIEFDPFSVDTTQIPPYADTDLYYTAFNNGGGTYTLRRGYFDFGWELLQVTTDEGFPTIPPYLYGAYVDEDSDYVYLSDGKTWRYTASFTKWGNGAPVTSPSGDDGQYLDVLSGDIYLNQSLVWVLQPYRIKLFFGSGAPITPGVDVGDVYVDTLNEVTYTYDGATWILDYFGVFTGNGAPTIIGQLDDIYIDMDKGDGYIHDGAQWVKTDKTN